jgi:hypothetical protein
MARGEFFAAPAVLQRRVPRKADLSERGRVLRQALTPEFLLAAACCRWPASPARDAAVRAAAAQVHDWEAFLRVVGRHRIAGLVHDALPGAGAIVPAAVGAKLAARRKNIAQRNRLLLGELALLQRAFAAEQIEFLVLKGAALAQIAYGSATCKQTRDIDLLVAPERARAALAVLERAGYAALPPAVSSADARIAAVLRYGREAEVARPGSNLLVDLQWRSTENPTLLDGVDVRSPAQDVELADGLVVRTLAADDLFAYLCVHGAYHHWWRLKWLADLNATLHTTGAEATARYRHAQKIGAGLCAGQALLLCRRLFDLPLPAALARELETNARTAKLEQIALRAMTRSPVAHKPMGAASANIRTQFLFGEGWRFFAAQCRAISVGTQDIPTVALPPALYFLYPVLRLPLWLFRRLRAALRG